MSETGPTTNTTTAPRTQPTLPSTQDLMAPTTTTPSVSQNGVTPGADVGVSAGLTDENTYTDTTGYTYTYPVGVKGRRVYDKTGKLIRYEGYRYYNTNARRLQATFGGTGAEFGKAPQYFAGDEDKIATWATEDVANLQKAMNALGYLGDDYRPGVVQTATKNAYARLLEDANNYGESVEDTIIRLASTSTATGGKGNLTQYRITNQSDIKSVINKVAERQLGRSLGEGDLNRLATLYNNLEREQGQTLAANRQAEVTSIPAVETFAESQLGRLYPKDVQARQFGSYLEAIKTRYQI